MRTLSRFFSPKMIRVRVETNLNSKVTVNGKALTEGSFSVPLTGILGSEPLGIITEGMLVRSEKKAQKGPLTPIESLDLDDPSTTPLEKAAKVDDHRTNRLGTHYISTSNTPKKISVRLFFATRDRLVIIDPRSADKCLVESIAALATSDTPKEERAAAATLRVYRSHSALGVDQTWREGEVTIVAPLANVAIAGKYNKNQRTLTVNPCYIDPTRLDLETLEELKKFQEFYRVTIMKYSTGKANKELPGRGEVLLTAEAAQEIVTRQLALYTSVNELHNENTYNIEKMAKHLTEYYHGPYFTGVKVPKDASATPENIAEPEAEELPVSYRPQDW